MTDDFDSLVAKLSLEQKVRLLSGADWWALHPEPAVGLRTMVLSDGPVGVRGRVHDDTDPSANLPSATAIAATWDVALVGRLARLLAAEARRKDVDVVLGPTINLHRSPLGGRHFECYSEDPLLTARLGTAYVRALQASGVGATPKHYVANDSETERFTIDVRADERTLREVYLRPFEDLVRDGGAWLVMAAYNQVNGVTMTESPLLDEPLKGEWGFDGVVVSDWFAARSTTAAGQGGLDLVMPSDRTPWADALVAAVRDGSVSERAINDKVGRLLRLASRVGALESGPAAVPVEPVPQAQTSALLREAAAAGMVLVSNPQQVLPLGEVSRVAVLGPHAAQARSQGGGSAEVHPAYTVSPLAGLRESLAGRAEVSYAPGVWLQEGLLPVAAPVATDPQLGEPGVRVELLAADGTVLRSDHRRGGNLRYTSGDLPAEAVQMRATTDLLSHTAGQWRFGFRGIGRVVVSIDGETVIDDGAFPEDVDMTSAWAHPPEWTVTRELAADQRVRLAIVYEILPDMPATVCLLGYEPPAPDPERELAAAVAAAREADVAVVVVGTTERVESEGFDRDSLRLPGRQDELVSAVAAVNPRTVVVVNSGSPVELPWRDEVAAILLAWFGGQEMGNALADVLLGSVEPGGRLPTTWPATEADVPVLNTTPTDTRLEYSEGIHIGYRAWLRADRTPAYPFGYGLGYTTWDYQSLEAEGGTLRVTVRNTGTRPGREVVQAYLSRPDSEVERPVRWLAGFSIASARPGETATVEIALDARSFQYWSTEQSRWVTESGAFHVAVGRSVLDTPLHGEVSSP